MGVGLRDSKLTSKYKWCMRGEKIMTTKNNKLPLFVPSDFDATVGTFFDGFSKILVAIAVLSGTLCISSDVIFGTMMPGIGLGVLLLNGFFWYDARREAKKRNQPGLVAMPARCV